MAGDDTLELIGDFMIPSAETLSLAGVATVVADTTDRFPISGNDSTLAAIIVNGGKLDVTGTSSNPVELESKYSNEGDWYGIVAEGGGRINLKYAKIRHAEEGISSASDVDSLTIDSSTFSDNELVDIDVDGDNSANITVSNNSVTVGGGTGILVSASDVSVTGNTVIGNSSSVRGIELGAASSNQLVSNNVVEDLSAGAAVYVSGTANKTPSVIKNLLQDSLKGVEVTTSKVHVGTAGSSGDANTITGNGVGVANSGSNAKAVIRFNEITSNDYGISSKNGAIPDVGTGSGGGGAGNNTITDNDTYCIWNRDSTVVVHAEYNYFGLAVCDTQAVCWLGNVDVSNVLCSEPSSYEMQRVLAGDNSGPLRLLGAWPNPMKGGGKIGYSANQKERVGVEVFDVAGRLVRDLGEVTLERGAGYVSWDGRGGGGSRVRDGVYFIRMVQNRGIVGTTKILVTH